MKKWFRGNRWCLMFALALTVLLGVQALGAEDDNSLSSLGIQTEGATVSPEFAYNVWSYTVTVPAGTTELALDPVPSSSSARIREISGTTLNENGSGYVTIVVEAANGSAFTYELTVVADGPAVETEPQTEAPTEPPTEKETETETEDPRYVRVDRNSLQEAENTITGLKNEITAYRDRLGLFTKIMYGLIGLAVVLLFVVINLLLRKKDIKAELDDYRSYGYTENKKSRKKAPQQGMGEGQQPYGYPQGVKPAGAGYVPAGQQPRQGQNMNGLDVQPQKSQKKAKTMPQYEQPAQQKKPSSGQQPSGGAPVKGQPGKNKQQPTGGASPMGQSEKNTQQPTGGASQKGRPKKSAQQPTNGAPAGKAGRNVEINMIDL